jgi:hypothetical protein
MLMPRNDDDEVGYRKPPKRRRFQKGRSGNPRGRARGSQNFAKLFATALDRRVVLTVNGERMKMGMRDALAAQLVNSAVVGSPRHILLLLRFDKLDANEPTVIWMSEEEAKL